MATITAYLGVDSGGIDLYEEPWKASAIRQRDDYVSLIRKAVQHSPSFGTAGTGYPMSANLQSWRESYDEPWKVGDSRNPRWIASGMVTLTVRCTDTSFTFDHGELTSYDLTVNKV